MALADGAAAGTTAGTTAGTAAGATSEPGAGVAEGPGPVSGPVSGPVPGGARGRRVARIGLVTPSTNTTLEPEFNRMAPAGVTVHAARVYQSGGQQMDSYVRMAADIGTAAMHLATAEVDAIAFGCTSCTYFVDPAEISRTMSEATGAPAILTATAVVEGLRALGAWRVALAGPRTEFVTRREAEFLESEGFEVVSCEWLGMGATDATRRAIGRVPPEEVHALAARADRPAADAIFISCTQLPTAPLIAELEARFAKPLVTSNQALLRKCLLACGIKPDVKGYGTLLENGRS